MTISRELDTLARKLAKRLQLEETSLTQMTDGFKALTQYHLGLVKTRKLPNDEIDETDEPESDTTIEGIRNQIRAVK